MQSHVQMRNLKDLTLPLQNEMQCFKTRKQRNKDEDSGRSGGFWLPMKSSRAGFLAIQDLTREDRSDFEIAPQQS